MRILLFSDSHGAIHNMLKAIHKNKNIDMIIHLGDFARDALELKVIHPDISLEIVKGNNDWSGEFPWEKLLELDGKKIFITHGHFYNVKHDYQRIVAKGKSVGADAVFFGHTHLTEETFLEGMLLLNPGSIGLSSQSGSPTCCTVEIKDEKILPRFVGFN